MRVHLGSLYTLLLTDFDPLTHAAALFVVSTINRSINIESQITLPPPDGLFMFGMSTFHASPMIAALSAREFVNF